MAKSWLDQARDLLTGFTTRASQYLPKPVYQQPGQLSSVQQQFKPVAQFKINGAPQTPNPQAIYQRQLGPVNVQVMNSGPVRFASEAIKAFQPQYNFGQSFGGAIGNRLDQNRLAQQQNDYFTQSQQNQKVIADLMKNKQYDQVRKLLDTNANQAQQIANQYGQTANQGQKIISNLPRQSLRAGISTLGFMTKGIPINAVIGGVIGGGLSKATGGDFWSGAGQGVALAPETTGLGEFTGPLISKMLNTPGAKNFVVNQIASRSLSGLANVGENRLLDNIDKRDRTRFNDVLDFTLGAIMNSPSNKIAFTKSKILYEQKMPDSVKKIIGKSIKNLDSLLSLWKLPVSVYDESQGKQVHIPYWQYWLQGKPESIRGTSELQSTINVGKPQKDVANARLGDVETYYHGTNKRAAQGLLKSQKPDLEKFGTGGDRNFAQGKTGILGGTPGFFGKGFYVADTVEGAAPYAQLRGTGEIVKIEMPKGSLLDAKTVDKKAVEQFWKSTLNQKRKANGAKPLTIQQIEDAVDELRMDKTEWIKTVNEYAQSLGKKGVKWSGGEIVILDPSGVTGIKPNVSAPPPPPSTGRLYDVSQEASKYKSADEFIKAFNSKLKSFDVFDEKHWSGMARNPVTEEAQLYRSFMELAQNPEYQAMYQRGLKDDDVLRAIYEKTKSPNLQPVEATPQPLQSPTTGEINQGGTNNPVQTDTKVVAQPPQVSPQAAPTTKSPGSPEESSLVQPKSPSSPEIIPQDPVQRLIKALREAKPIRSQQEALYTQTRAKQAGALAGIQAQMGGEAGYYKQLGQLKGELPKVQYESIKKNFTSSEVKMLYNKINENTVLGPFEKVNAQHALAKMLGVSGGQVPTESELRLLNEVFPKELTQALLEKRPFIQKLIAESVDALGVPRAIMATMDFSAPLRQGIFLIGRPKQWVPAFTTMFKYAFNEKAYNEGMAAMKSDPFYRVARDNRLSLTEMGTDLSTREETFMSSLVDKIPGVGAITKASNRAYSGFLNKLRFDTYKDLIKSAKEVGAYSPKMAADAAKFVNSATGRGDLGSLQKAAPIFNAVFFSPRLVASRLNLLNPVYYAKLDPFVRKEALKSLFTFAATGLTVATLSKLGGADVGTDPRSADFGKIKIGNTRYDPWGGFQQYIRLAAQLITGQKVNSTTGVTMTLGEGYKPVTRMDIIQQFFENKESPVASFVTGLLNGTNGVGKPFNVGEEVRNRFIPLVLQDMQDLVKEHGIAGIPMAIPGIFGVGSMTYNQTALDVVRGRNGLDTQIRELIKQGRKNEARALIAKNRQLLEWGTQLEPLQKEINKQLKLKTQAQKDTRLTPEQKRNIQQAIDLKVKRLNDIMDNEYKKLKGGGYGQTNAPVLR